MQFTLPGREMRPGIFVPIFSVAAFPLEADHNLCYNISSLQKEAYDEIPVFSGKYPLSAP